MKKSLIAFLLFLGMASNYAFAEENSIAVVDLQKLVSNSAQVKQLKQEHSKKMEELNKIIVNARGAIANETDSAKLVQLEEKYTREFNTKKQALEKDGYNVLYIALYGSQNYGVSDEYSDIDAKAIVLPKIDDIVFIKRKNP